MENESSPAQIRSLHEILTAPVDIVVNYAGVEIRHRLRKPTSQEELTFRKQSAAIKFTNGKAEPSDIAFAAPINFYDTICVAINDESEDLENLKSEIPPDVKAAVVLAYQGRFSIISKNGD